MMLRILLRAVACLILMTIGSISNAADISHQLLFDGIEGIGIDGDISAADVQKFRDISVKYKKAIVVLSSNGGALMPAIEIGKIIKITGYATIVPEDAVCASSCALIWVAGSTRFLSSKGYVGFHASYRDNNGKLEESGVANALIGNYLTLLNFSEKAIIFATRASPDRILWLNKANKDASGIDFSDFDPESDKQAQPVRPPVLHIEAPPAPLGNVRASSGVEWIYYAENKNGTVLFYDRNSIKKTGSYVKVWVKKDFSKDKTTPKRESKELWNYSCDGQSATVLMWIDYNQNGEVINSQTISTYQQTFDPLVPGSVGMALWEAVCN